MSYSKPRELGEGGVVLDGGEGLGAESLHCAALPRTEPRHPSLGRVHKHITDVQ